MKLQSPTIQLIPLNLLVTSPRNVRRKDRKTDIDALAASIASRGLLQNLCVVPNADGKFEVDAGGRRHLALKKLAKSGTVAKDFPVPCHVVAVEDGQEVSLIENVHRVAMDAMDEVEAYAALVGGGSTADAVARRFGVTRRHVDQRLALAALSPKIKAAWKRGDLTLDAARAFCLVADHSQQDAVFRSMSKPVTNPASVRARLMDGRMRASDRLALFVGLDAYEAAGGKVLRDLFDNETVFVEDPALMTRLAEEKLEGSKADILAQGWLWVDVHLGHGRLEGLANMRLYPEWRDPTPEEQAELDRLTGEIEKLNAELEATEDDDDPRWSTRDDLEAAYETVRQTAREWSVEAKQLSGVVLSLNHEGEVSTNEGCVRAEDEKRVLAFNKAKRDAQQGNDHDSYEVATGTPEPHRSALPKAVNRDLTTVRTRVIRQALANDPDVALAVCVAALARRALQTAEFTGVGLSATMRRVDDDHAGAHSRDELEAQLPKEESQLLDWALDQSRERLLSALAGLVAGSVDLAHEDTSPSDLGKQAIADILAQHLDIDMTQHWQADVDFWLRLPKTTLMGAVSAAPAIEAMSKASREALLKAHAKLRKEELAAKVDGLYKDTAYLPDILTTPIAANAVHVTPAGMAILDATASAAA